MFQPHVIETGPNCHENYGTLIRGVPIYEADFLFANSFEFLKFKMYFHNRVNFHKHDIMSCEPQLTWPGKGPDFDPHRQEASDVPWVMVLSN